MIKSLASELHHTDVVKSEFSTWSLEAYESLAKEMMEDEEENFGQGTSM